MKVNGIFKSRTPPGVDTSDPEYQGILPAPPKGPPTIERRVADADLSDHQLAGLIVRAVGEMAGLLELGGLEVQDQLDAGRLTALAAVLRFQAAKTLIADGVLGPNGTVPRGQPVPEIRAVAVPASGPVPPDLVGPAVTWESVHAADEYRRAKAEREAQDA